MSDGLVIAGNNTRSPRQVHEAEAEKISSFMRPGPPKKNWELTRLQAVHHEILRLKLTGMKNTQIARLLNISAPTVQYTINSPIGQEKLSLMQSAKDCDSIDFAKRMQDLLPDIANLFTDTVKGNNEAELGERLKYATIIAKDFAGMAVPKQIHAQHNHLHATLTHEEIEDLKQRGLEQARAAGILASSESESEIIDAEFEE